MFKRLFSFALCISLVVCMSANVLAFSFPEPDWGALLRQRREMVEEADFELYTEADITYAPFYGAKFEPRGGTFMGAIPEKSADLLPVGAYFTNIYDMYQDDFYYPANVMIPEANVVTMAGWTISDMAAVDYNQVRRVLENLNSYNKPVLIRFANEMNCSSLGDNPTLYVDTFRKVANMIHEYPNLGVVWSPIDIGALDRPFEYYYPGDEYVDWVGISCYSMRYFQGNVNTDPKNTIYFMCGDYGWATNRVKPFMEFLQTNNINKPVMIAEGGVSTNNAYGEELSAWAAPRLRNLLWYLNMKYPQIKMINYFDNYRGDETERFNISEFGYAVDIFNEAKQNGSYIEEFGNNSEFVFAPVNNAGTVLAKNGMVNLYTLAYIPKTPSVNVNYFVDGVWYHSANQIPYKCALNVASLSDGAHTLEISGGGQRKSYAFYKNGNFIRFGAEPEPFITVLVNGKKVYFDQPPVTVNDRTLVPVRAIFEALGASVEWIDSSQTVIAVRGGLKVSIQIGNTVMQVGNEQKVLDVPAMLINDRTLVPARAVSEAFNCKVQWDEATKTVLITT